MLKSDRSSMFVITFSWASILACNCSTLSLCNMPVPITGCTQQDACNLHQQYLVWRLGFSASSTTASSTVPPDGREPNRSPASRTGLCGRSRRRAEGLGARWLRPVRQWRGGLPLWATAKASCQKITKLQIQTRRFFGCATTYSEIALNPFCICFQVLVANLSVSTAPRALSWLEKSSASLEQASPRSTLASASCLSRLTICTKDRTCSRLVANSEEPDGTKLYTTKLERHL